MKKRIVIFALIVLVISKSHAASVSVKDGNIYYVDNGLTTQLTSLGRDEYPSLHPKGEWVYFVRGGAGKWKDDKYYPAKDEVIENGIVKDELWRIKKDGSKAKRLFRNDRASAATSLTLRIFVTNPPMNPIATLARASSHSYKLLRPLRSCRAIHISCPDCYRPWHSPALSLRPSLRELSIPRLPAAL